MKARVLRVHRPGLVPWRDALDVQRRLAARASQERFTAHLVLLEHPPVLTLGRNARPANVLASASDLSRRGIALEKSDRGGDVTWHGPGQVVGYPVLHLPSFKLGVSSYVHGLEEAMIRVCAAFGVEARAGDGSIGVWTPAGKIGSIGIHVSRGVVTHGFALNACPDLAAFTLINPCGQAGCAVTSLEREASRPVTWSDAAALMEREVAALLSADRVESAAL